MENFIPLNMSWSKPHKMPIFRDQPAITAPLQTRNRHPWNSPISSMADLDATERTDDDDVTVSSKETTADIFENETMQELLENIREQCFGIIESVTTIVHMGEGHWDNASSKNYHISKNVEAIQADISILHQNVEDLAKLAIQKEDKPVVFQNAPVVRSLFWNDENGTPKSTCCFETIKSEI